MAILIIVAIAATAIAGTAAVAASGDGATATASAARGELARGVSEDAGPNKDKAGRIKGYFMQATGYVPQNGGPWCAAFASWCRLQGNHYMGDHGTEFGSASCGKLERAARKAGLLSNEPSIGAVALMDTDRNGRLDHCGIVVDISPSHVECVEGNYSNKVSLVRRERSKIRSYIK